MPSIPKWLTRFNAVIEDNINDSLLTNDRLAEAMIISERHLFRKVKALTKMPPQRYLSQYRLKKAMQYLQNGKYRTVKETAFSVGFKNPSYFIRQFEKTYGKKPLQVLREGGWR